MGWQPATVLAQPAVPVAVCEVPMALCWPVLWQSEHLPDLPFQLLLTTAAEEAATEPAMVLWQPVLCEPPVVQPMAPALVVACSLASVPRWQSVHTLVAAPLVTVEAM